MKSKFININRPLPIPQVATSSVNGPRAVQCSILGIVVIVVSEVLVCQSIKDMKDIAAKLSFSVFLYSDILGLVFFMSCVIARKSFLLRAKGLSLVVPVTVGAC